MGYKMKSYTHKDINIKAKLETEYTRLACSKGGRHENSVNACGGDYGVCEKCKETIKHIDGEWYS